MVAHVGLDPEALRRLLTRKPVILPASTGELVKLELGEIDFEWLAEFATRSLCEMIYDEGPPFAISTRRSSSTKTKPAVA
jgi:hypothetical protein